MERTPRRRKAVQGKIKFFVVALALIALVNPLVLAEESLQERIENAFNEKGKPTTETLELIERANEYSEKVPDSIKAVFGSERINAEIELKNGEKERIGIELRNAKIKALQKGYLKNATIEAKTNEETVQRIIMAEDKAKELKKALDDGSISYKPIGIISTAKITITKFLYDAFSFITGKVSLTELHRLLP
ncbi:MAG: hypothetical protein AB1467_04695 [Candidatus Diapherotrites archaeon]